MFLFWSLDKFENIYLQNKVIWIVKLLGKSGSEINVKIIKIGNLLYKNFLENLDIWKNFNLI